MNIEPQKCRASDCPVMVQMLKHRGTGKFAPIEIAPTEDGNILVDIQTGTYLILTKEALTKAREKGHPLHLNHFARCAFARRFGARADFLKKRGAAA